MTAPSPPMRSFEAELDAMRADIEMLRVAITSPQLGGSSLDGAALQVRSADGTTILGNWGVQPDGTMGTKSLNTVPPPPPGAATVTPIIAGLDVAWSGQLTGNMPADFRCVNVHVSLTPDFIVGPSNHVGSFVEAGSITVAPLPYATHYVKLVAVNRADARSQASLQASGSPLKVVADAVLDGIVKETSLAEAAVTKAKLAAGSVTQTAVAPGSIGTPQLIAGSVQAAQLAADSVQAGKIAASAITAREVKALSLTGDLIAANAIDAGHVKAGAVTAKHLETDLALASRLIAGNPTGTRVELSASGMLVVRANGETTFQVDSATGDVTSMGQYYTSRFGERIAMNVAGLSEPTIRAYPRRGNRYADLRSYTRTIGSVDVANWEVRLPLQGTEAGLFDFMVYNSSFQPIASSRLRFRPFNNSSGIVHPGWAADGQDVAIVFYGGRAFITNSANTDRRPLNCGELYAEDNVITRAGLKVGDAETPVNGRITTRELTAEGNILVKGNLYVRGQINPPSERRLKNHVDYLTDGLAKVRQLRPARFTWKDPKRYDAKTHLGIYVDELATADQDALTAPIDWDKVPTSELGPAGGNQPRGYEDRALLALLTSAVQGLDDENQKLQKTITDLQSRVATLTTQLKKIPGVTL